MAAGWGLAFLKETTMNTIWTASGAYSLVEYDNEADLEDAISKVQNDLFGPKRIYLPVKKKIGVKGGLRNIPDGYLIDLSGRQPRLYVVETELAAHDPLRHIAVQILEFSLSFKSEGRKVKAILFEALQKLPDPRSECEKYAREHGLRNLDRFLEFLVFETDFAALVIIDAIQENLDVILGEKFKFGVEVIEIQRYQNKARDRFYRFEPFLADVSQDVGPYQTDEVDTVVVPAHKDGAEETFLGEDRWYEIRIHGSMRP
jgi:hypothetical protein